MEHISELFQLTVEKVRNIFPSTPQLSKVEGYSSGINFLAFLTCFLHKLRFFPGSVKSPQAESSREFIKQGLVCRDELKGYGKSPIAIATPTLQIGNILSNKCSNSK